MSSLTAQTHAHGFGTTARNQTTHTSVLTLRSAVALMLLGLAVAILGVLAWQPAVIITAGLMTSLAVPLLVTALLVNYSAE